MFLLIIIENVFLDNLKHLETIVRTSVLVPFSRALGRRWGNYSVIFVPERSGPSVFRVPAPPLFFMSLASYSRESPADSEIINAPVLQRLCVTRMFYNHVNVLKMYFRVGTILVDRYFLINESSIFHLILLFTG